MAKMVDTELLTYSEAINEALHLVMQADPDIYVLGQLVDTKAGIFGTTTGLADDYSNRVFDMPIAEGLMHAMGIGLAIKGKRPVLCHQRIDFMAPGLDAIINWMGLWYFKTRGQELPITIRAIVGKGWGQAPQHSKNLASLLAAIPGIDIYCPTTPRDAKGMTIDAVNSNRPSVVIEHRSLFGIEQPVPHGLYVTTQAPSRLLRGDDLTVVAIGDSVPLALSAFKQSTYSVDLFDLRMIKPLGGIGFHSIVDSAAVSGRLLIVDSAWTEFGISSEIAARVIEEASVPVAVRRIGYPRGYTPMSRANERAFYPSIEQCREMASRLLDNNRE